MDGGTFLPAQRISHGNPSERPSHLVNDVADRFHDGRLILSELHALLEVDPPGPTRGGGIDPADLSRIGIQRRGLDRCRGFLAAGAGGLGVLRGAWLPRGLQHALGVLRVGRECESHEMSPW